ncbi:MAG: ead/Ea22-like family protein [Klebsiella pneumoniae]|nr:ead/Ea22-like family protein [Klebsiella pneumoniae]
MTDITELAQSLKAAAEKATPGEWVYFPKNTSIEYDVGSDESQGSILYVDSGDFTQVQTDRNGEFIALANPANILALVEALEKAHAVMNAVVTAAAIRGVRPFDGIDCDPPTLEENAEACGDAMSARIRELEANPPKPHHNGLMQISNELASAKQRIAELESRTVTVKLPDIMPPEAAPAHYWGEGESMAYVDGYNKSAADLKTSFAQACSFAGVNVEFE